MVVDGEAALLAFKTPDPDTPPDDPVISTFVLAASEPAIVVLEPLTVHALVSVSERNTVCAFASLPLDVAVLNEVRYPLVRWGTA